LLNACDFQKEIYDFEKEIYKCLAYGFSFFVIPSLKKVCDLKELPPADLARVGDIYGQALCDFVFCVGNLSPVMGARN
jgi:hypothetical protein